MPESPKPVQQSSWKVEGYRRMGEEYRRKVEAGEIVPPPPPPWAWKPIEYAPKTGLQKKIRKALKDAGDLTPDAVMQAVNKVAASIKPADRDEALRTALLICVLEVANSSALTFRGKLGGEPKVW